MNENETDESTEEPAEDVFAGDDPKAKFREALARKTGSQGQGGGEAGASKVGSAHGPAKAQRTFRRKSGG
ncbi:DUF5302 domain-containing protein [Sporichthya sp.]|uniref:DUF5302 domain-containing protein n=1 Tax=Sporichthya sp. TaxID=65475 RepID=UPI0018549603|nr:DUF5302 domain-containing protein [Sporichthya sp.]MBA3745575.1 DUF5302 domain-containing protein [Sporichthya sp.]